jgi:hypothetical protein
MDKKKKKSTPALKLAQALQQMRCGACLICLHTVDSGTCWCVIPGGRIADPVAAEIRRHPAVMRGFCPQFPNHEAWQMAAFV